MAQLNDLLVLGDTNLQGDVVSQSNVTAPKFIGALQGNADTATALTSNAGSANTPVYFANGKPTACSYTLAKSVPADAKFTDTVYTLPAATSSALGGVKIGSNITLSSGTISLTKANVTSALGYTPPTTDTDTGATSVEVTGSGSAVTAASYDAATRKLTLTKGSTFNNYSLPTATTSALGGVKAGATITSSSGYTACPILNGVLYYKDTKYTLSSFDITATATELNYTDGVTSNIQTQLDDKLPLSGGTVTGNILFSNSSTQPNQPNLKWKTIKNNSNVDRTPYVGYCTASSDGTFMVGSLEGTNYTTGLAIGGSSGNLLWKSKPVVTSEKILAGANTSVTSDSAGNVTIAATDTKYTAGTGLTLSGTDFRVTASDASEIMNQLSEGSSPALPDDYLIAQYAGGGSTTKTYHRRKVKNIITGDNVKAALGTGTETTKFLRNDGTWQVPTDSHGNDIAQTYLTAEVINPTNAVPAVQGKTVFAAYGILIYQNTGVRYPDFYISTDNGFHWSTLYSDTTYNTISSYIQVQSHFCTPRSGYNSRTIWGLCYNVKNSAGNYTILQLKCTVNNDGTFAVTVNNFNAPATSLQAEYAAIFNNGYYGIVIKNDTTHQCYIYANSGWLLYNFEKTGSINYQVQSIFKNYDESTGAEYYYFVCGDYSDNMTSNVQRIYRAKCLDDWSNTTITSGAVSLHRIQTAVSINEYTALFLGQTYTQYDNSAATKTAVYSFISGTYKAITLPVALQNEYIWIIPVNSWDFIIAGYAADETPYAFYYTTTFSVYQTDSDGTKWEEPSGYSLVKTYTGGFLPTYNGRICNYMTSLKDDVLLLACPYRNSASSAAHSLSYSKMSESFLNKYTSQTFIKLNGNIILQSLT